MKERFDQDAPTIEPYRPPIANRNREGTGSFRIGSILWLAFGFPVLPVASVYGCWFLAWFMQQAIPVPMRDDPKSFDGWMPILYLFAWLTLLTAPLGVSLGLFAVASIPIREDRGGKRIFLVIFYGMISLGCLIFMAIDPFDTVDWFFD